MAYPHNIREEELKSHIAKDWFSSYDTTHILGDIDFTVAVPKSDGSSTEIEFLLWAEAKKGSKPVEESFAQLILTIGKARTFESYLPPKFIGAFDADRIVFLPYEEVQEIFYKNDFNWNVTPSDHTAKEFKEVLELVTRIFPKSMYAFEYDNGKKDLARFIKSNFILGKKKISRIRISKNNFVVIYQKWLKKVKPTIDVNWEEAKKQGVFDSDFYLADILSAKNKTIQDKLHVLLRETYYELDRKKNAMGLFTSSKAKFTDDQEVHSQFWNCYDRPPKEEYWEYIIKRRDLLVPPDVRERHGSYFTPQQWVELSQQYLEKELGENWQDEYYIWDCAAGTGNLLNGLVDKYKIWASTLDKADVDVMQERIKNGANLLPSHIFQFDFLNDSFDKLPDGLRDIINDEERRKRLVIYINPPYAEAGDSKQLTSSGKNKKDVAVSHQTYRKYIDRIGIAGREVFAQFLFRIYDEIPSVIIANFSKLKNLQAPNFKEFRKAYLSKLSSLFVVPANTFDNVKGSFPIGFFIWDTSVKETFREIIADVYDSKANFIGTKNIVSYDGLADNIGHWVNGLRDDTNSQRLGFMSNGRNDFQNQKLVYFMNKKEQMPTPRGWWITPKNLSRIMIFVAVRHAIQANWLNDRDQFLTPDSQCENDELFISDCLIYSIFSGANTIQSSISTNHWIPFREEEVGARDAYKSHFMIDYISGKTRPKKEADLFTGAGKDNEPLHFSPEATAVFDTGRELWKYYHSQEDSNPNASLYDIKMYFQGTKTLKSGKIQMKPDSEDETYSQLLLEIRERMKVLAKRIEPKIYQYGFLK